MTKFFSNDRPGAYLAYLNPSFLRPDKKSTFVSGGRFPCFPASVPIAPDVPWILTWGWRIIGCTILAGVIALKFA